MHEAAWSCPGHLCLKNTIVNLIYQTFVQVGIVLFSW